MKSTTHLLRQWKKKLTEAAAQRRTRLAEEWLNMDIHLFKALIYRKNSQAYILKMIQLQWIWAHWKSVIDYLVVFSTFIGPGNHPPSAKCSHFLVLILKYWVLQDSSCGFKLITALRHLISSHNLQFFVLRWPLCICVTLFSTVYCCSLLYTGLTSSNKMHINRNSWAVKV